MNAEELFTLSLKAIWGNKMRSFLTTLGIIIGVFSIIVLISIGTGLQSYINKQIAAFGPNLIDVMPGNMNSIAGMAGSMTEKLTMQDAKNLKRKFINTAKVAPTIQQVANVRYKNTEDKNVFIIGTTAEYPLVAQNTKVKIGSFFTRGQEISKVVVIGPTVLKKLFNDKPALGKKIFIGNSTYSVIGVTDKIGSTFGIDMDNMVYIPIEVIRQQFGSTTIREIIIAANSKELVPIVRKQTKEILLKRLSEDEFSVETSESISSTVGNITGMLSVALGGIAAISLLVGGIGVANIMLVSVTERTKEIGIRKALGAKRRDILLQFLIEAVMISVTGGVVGIILGMVASIAIAIVLVSSVTLWSVLLAFCFSVAIGIIFGMAPAIRASKLSPIDALRYE
ncbi:MAG: ABC transporter permease [Patescibacteria group bacterium]|nr:ABC transporter permease [Patescibacteria group bacterium]